MTANYKPSNFNTFPIYNPLELTCFVGNYYCLNYVSERDTKFTSFPGWQEKM